MNGPNRWQLVERRLLANGRVRVTVSLGPGRRVHFTMDPSKATDDAVQAMVDAAVSSGRYDPLPARNFE